MTEMESEISASDADDCDRSSDEASAGDRPRTSTGAFGISPEPQRIAEPTREHRTAVAASPGPDSSGPNSREQYEQYYGVDIDTPGEVETLQRLEQSNTVQQVRGWADEGMPIAAMGTPSKMQAYRQRKGTPVPWDVERRNRQSLQRSERRAGNDSPAGETQVPDSVRDVTSSPGQPLEASVQRAMEDRMGEDFSDVQIHAGHKAARAADDIDAKAFTVGNHVAFNRGEYDPSSPEGQHVIAHELAHVRQQTGGAVSMLPQDDVDLEIDPDPDLEREAEETAQRVMQGGELGIQRLVETDVHIQRMTPRAVGGGSSGAGPSGAGPSGATPPTVAIATDPEFHFHSLNRDSIIMVRDALQKIVDNETLGAPVGPGNPSLPVRLHQQGIGLGRFGPRETSITEPNTLREQIGVFVQMIADEIANSAQQSIRELDTSMDAVRERQNQMEGVIERTETREWEDREVEDLQNSGWWDSYTNSFDSRWQQYRHWWQGLAPRLRQDGPRTEAWKTERGERKRELGRALESRQRQTYQYLNSRDRTARWRRIRERAEIEHERTSNNFRDIYSNHQQATQAMHQANQYREAIHAGPINDKLDNLEPAQHQYQLSEQINNESVVIPNRSLHDSRSRLQKLFNAESGKTALSHVANWGADALSLLAFIQAGHDENILKENQKRLAALIGAIPMERTAGFSECPDCGHTNDGFIDSGLIGSILGMFVAQAFDEESAQFVAEAAATIGTPIIESWLETCIEYCRHPEEHRGRFDITCERCRTTFNPLNTGIWTGPEHIAARANAERASAFLETRRGAGPERPAASTGHMQQRRAIDDWRTALGMLGSAAGWSQVGTDLSHYRGLGGTQDRQPNPNGPPSQPPPSPEGAQGYRPYSPPGSIRAGVAGAISGPLISKTIRCPRPGCYGHVNRYVLNSAGIGRAVGAGAGLAATKGVGQAIRAGRGVGSVGGLTMGHLGANLYRTLTGRRGARNPARAECELCRWQWNIAGEGWNAVWEAVDPTTMDGDNWNYSQQWVIDSRANDQEAYNDLALPPALQDILLDNRL